jgi:hypothetical protein
VYGVKRKFLIFLYGHIVLRLFVCKLKEKEEKKEEGEEKISNKQNICLIKIVILLI